MAKSPRTERTIAEKMAEAYINALQAKDKKWILSLLADDFALVIPLNTSGTNDLSDSWNGLEAAAANYDVAFREIEILKYADIEITPGQDANIAFLEGRGVMTMRNGRPQNNRYVFRFDIEGGKIKRIREYANPVTSAISFGIPLPVQTSDELGQQMVTAKPRS